MNDLRSDAKKEFEGDIVTLHKNKTFIMHDVRLSVGK